MGKTVLRTRRYKAGYEVRYELVDGKEFSMDDFKMRSAYTPSGDYIGDPKMAYALCKKRGIAPEKARSDHNVCSIGFNAEEQKWYGWSHRALYGFGVGDVAEEGDCCTTSGFTEEYTAAHPDEVIAVPVGFKAKTLADARRMAEAFAESVS